MVGLNSLKSCETTVDGPLMDLSLLRMLATLGAFIDMSRTQLSTELVRFESSGRLITQTIRNDRDLTAISITRQHTNEEINYRYPFCFSYFIFYENLTLII